MNFDKFCSELPPLAPQTPRQITPSNSFCDLEKQEWFQPDSATLSTESRDFGDPLPHNNHVAHPPQPRHESFADVIALDTETFLAAITNARMKYHAHIYLTTGRFDGAEIALRHVALAMHKELLVPRHLDAASGAIEHLR